MTSQEPSTRRATTRTTSRGLAFLLAALLVSLWLAAESSARPPSVVSASDAQGRITALTSTQITVKGRWLPDWAPSDCTLAASSPAVTGYKIGDTVLIACQQGVLTRIVLSSANRLGPTIPIPGIRDSFNPGLPTPGAKPTAAKCAAAWNATAPPAARQAMGIATPLGAQVTIASGSVSSPNGQQIAHGYSCQITFFLAGRTARIAIVSSWWKHDTTDTWSGWIEYENLAEFYRDTPNYTVSPNGTLSRS